MRYRRALLPTVPLRIPVAERGLGFRGVELERRTGKENRNVEAANALEAIWQEVELLRSLDPKAVAAVAQAQKVKR